MPKHQEYTLFDKIYKKIIAEAVFSGESKYFAIQSKIMMESLKTHKINGKKIQTGNCGELMHFFTSPNCLGYHCKSDLILFLFSEGILFSRL